MLAQKDDKENFNAGMIVFPRKSARIKNRDPVKQLADSTHQYASCDITRYIMGPPYSAPPPSPQQNALHEVP